ncbi:MAG: SlyX protein [Deltaproteobacteria bacterium]|nr:MAG: SlyX protein [Deltaproteobacteria bacterium]
MQELLEELEVKVAFQDQLIEKLQEGLLEQDKQILALTREVETMRAQVNNLMGALGGIEDESTPEPPPPHY